MFRFIMKYFENIDSHPAPFLSVNTIQPPSKKLKVEENVTDLEVVESSFSLLMMAPAYFKHIWDWTEFMNQYMSHKNPEIRWIVCQCLATISEMAENSKIRFMTQQNLSDQEIRMFTSKYFRKTNFSTEPVHHQNDTVRFWLKSNFFFLFDLMSNLLRLYPMKLLRKCFQRILWMCKEYYCKVTVRLISTLLSFAIAY